MRKATAAYSARPRKFDADNRDCSVRALRIVANCDYEQAHTTLAKLGRKMKRGIYNSTMDAACACFALTRVSAPAGGSSPYPTLAQFLREHRTGRFLIQRTGHYFAVIDGVVHDWPRGTGARSRVRCVWGAQA